MSSVFRDTLPFLVVVFGICSAAPPVCADALFRGDPEHSGVYDSTSVPALDRIKWKFKTGAKVLSSPAVDGGTVYIGSATTRSTR